MTIASKSLSYFVTFVNGLQKSSPYTDPIKKYRNMVLKSESSFTIYHKWYFVLVGTCYTFGKMAWSTGFE